MSKVSVVPIGMFGFKDLSDFTLTSHCNCEYPEILGRSTPLFLPCKNNGCDSNNESNPGFYVRLEFARPSSFPRTHAIPCSSDESLLSTDDILSSIDDTLSSIDDILPLISERSSSNFS